MPEEKILPAAHPSMRRSEEFRLDQFIGQLHILEVFDGRCAETNVVERVVAHTVSTSFDVGKQLRIFTHVVAYHKESGFDAVMVERVENPRGGLWDGAVVEGDIYRLLITFHPPDGAGIEPSQPFAALFD